MSVPSYPHPSDVFPIALPPPVMYSVLRDDVPLYRVDLNLWEDGVFKTVEMSSLDRWTSQAAQSLDIYVANHKIRILQDPHSPHLGGYIWDSAQVFCCYMLAVTRLETEASRNKKLGKYVVHSHRMLSISKLKVLELGAGVGLPGLFVGALGAEVVITDIPQLVPVMQQNIVANHVGNRVHAMQLSWGNAADEESYIHQHGYPDLVILADCIYSEASADALVGTLNNLCTDATVVFCVSEIRNKEAQDLFFQSVAGSFTVSRIPPVEWWKLVPEGLRSDHIHFSILMKTTRPS
eukprot:ANDGO_03463.mRNA.1 Protein-lysine methyltransferase C42C1.13